VNRDFIDILAALVACRARFLVVGAHALAVHGVPRATGDLDIWLDPAAENAERVWAALGAFGAPLESLDLGQSDLQTPEQVIQIGLPPRRIDLLTAISGVEFDEAWAARVTHSIDGIDVTFLGREELVRNKKASGRYQDLADLESLGEKTDDA
jgi:predicted nucleotidyltransferase